MKLPLFCFCHFVLNFIFLILYLVFGFWYLVLDVEYWVSVLGMGMVLGGLWGQTYFFSIRAKCHITLQSRILRQLACCSCCAVTATACHITMPQPHFLLMWHSRSAREGPSVPKKQSAPPAAPARVRHHRHAVYVQYTCKVHIYRFIIYQASSYAIYIYTDK